MLFYGEKMCIVLGAVGRDFIPARAIWGLWPGGIDVDGGFLPFSSVGLCILRT